MDNQAVIDIFKIINNNVTELKHIFRLGVKSPNKCRPIKVVMNNVDDVITLLRGSSRLKSNANFKSIILKKDKTPLELEDENSTKKEFSARKEADERNISLKYKRGLLTIVSSTPEN